MQRCWAGDRRDGDGRDRAQVGNSGALFAAFITSWSWNQHGEHGPLRLVDGDGGVGRSEGEGPLIKLVIIICLSRHASTLSSLSGSSQTRLKGLLSYVSSQTRTNFVIITCVFPDKHELCHLYQCVPRHARSVSSLSVSSQTHMKGAPS